MDWLGPFFLIVGGLIVLMAIGMPIAFAFLAINMLGAFMYMGGLVGLNQMALSAMDSVASFSFLPVPLFVLMGEFLFRSGIAGKLMDVIDLWLGRVPGRLSLMAVGGGTLFATLAGSAAATTALLGKILVPDMTRRGYKHAMSIGPIMGSGGLAVMIPPSTLGVILAATADLPVGLFLLAIVVPGFMMATLYATYVVVRCWLQPGIAPQDNALSRTVPLSLKIRNTIVYGFPAAVIIFVVTGLIFLGVATETEAAALGVLASVALAALYGQLDWAMVRDSLYSTMLTTIMVLMILSGSTGFSQLMAYTGVSSGLIEIATASSLPPVLVVLSMQIVLLVLGTFMESLAMILLTVPIYFPVIKSLGLSPLWFGAIMLLNMEMAAISPPFGFGLFVMKAVSPPGTKMTDVYMASIPFLALSFVVMLVMIFFPPVVTFLPSVSAAAR